MTSSNMGRGVHLKVLKVTKGYILKPFLRTLFISNWATFYRFISSKGSGGEKNPPMDMLFNLPPLFSPLSGDYRELSLEAF